MKGIFIVLIIGIFLLEVISADFLMPGQRAIEVNNKITNINDFPNYVFVSYGHISPSMCPIKIISENGKISDYYKGCNPSVYAIPKDKFNESKIININKSNHLKEIEIINYLKEIVAIEVINEIETYRSVREDSTIKEINNTYIIDQSKIKNSPDDIIQKKDYTPVIVYSLIFILSGAIILIIIFRRKK